MMKKMWMMILLLGIISVSGCHTTQRASVRAGYYDPYPRYSSAYFYDPYPRYYSSAYFYDPYPYFFFGGDFFFFDQYRRPFPGSHRFVQPNPSLRGRRWGGGSGFSSPGHSSPAPSPGQRGGGGSGPHLR